MYDKDAGMTIVSQESVDKAVRAMKVLLLDSRNRAYLKSFDPKAFKQLVEAVREFDPDIVEKIKEAEEYNLRQILIS
jgi:hypothetical protein